MKIPFLFTNKCGVRFKKKKILENLLIILSKYVLVSGDAPIQGIH